MKRLGTIAVIAGLLLATALFYRFRPEEEPVEPPEVTTTTPDPTPVEPPADDRPTPTTDASADGTLSIEAGMSHGYLASGTSDETYAAIDIEAKEVEGGARPPLNMALVIDRSGSMNGTKMQYAKRAAQRLVDELGPHDRLSIVSYSTDVSVDISSRRATEAAKASMRASIDRLGAAGGTNISGGFTRGTQQVQQNKSQESINRVVMLSDGRATVGTTHIPQLRQMARQSLQKGVSLTTMGVGLDYNEDLMSAMADEASGNYYFIDKPDTVVSILESEFDALAETVARKTSLVITLPDGVELEQLYGFSHKRTRDQVLVSLAEFQSGQTKNILLKLRPTADKAGKLPIMGVDLSYQDITDDKDKNHTLELAAVVTDDVEKTEEMVNTEVISRVQQVEVANSLQVAMAAYQDGNTAQAQEQLRNQRRSLRKAREKYNLEDKSFDKADRELSGTSSNMQRSAPSSAAGKRTIKSKKARGRMIMKDKSSF
ncbi:MAG: vWA domain-containing protein [Persicimonas sp.]